MRQIKFRAWNKETSEMVDLKKITPLALDAGMNTQLAMQGCDGLFIPFFPNLELMEFTGLKDKNGREIYEGDIVLSKPLNDANGPRDDKYRAKCEIKFRIGFYLDGPVWGLLDGEHEVIGNIWENPDLLK